MPIGAGIGEAEEDYGYLRGDFVTDFVVGTSSPGGYYPSISVGTRGYIPPAIRYYAPPASIPEIYPTVTIEAPGSYAPEAYEDDPLLPSAAGVQVIDPGEETQATVFEDAPGGVYGGTAPPAVFRDAPGGIYEVEREETDWEEYYRRYSEINLPTVPVLAEEDEVFDWFSGGIQDIANLGQTVGLWGGAPAVQVGGPSGAPPGMRAAPPARVTVDTRTGRITTCKRRRRRKLLTESDFNVLLRVATLPNKENVRIVLGKAIGRS